ncbi:MAG: 4Fe-4S dicluster domain-containing protein, partial [Anaeromyxobacteraceae bacterium]
MSKVLHDLVDLVAVILPSCTGCGACVAPCRPRAIALDTELPGGFGAKRALVDPARCTGCGDCLPACRHGALAVVG